MALLEVNNLTKRYGKFVALDGVNLSLGEGKIVGLLGPNGSGKSTLMKCIAGLLTIDGGSITVDGKPLRQRDEKDRFVSARKNLSAPVADRRERF